VNNRLARLLRDHGIAEDTIIKAVDSGYFLKDWLTSFSGDTRTTVSDLAYGNKALSSSFEIDQFVQHLRGNYVFEPLPAFREVIVRNRHEVLSALNDDPLRRRYIAEGSLSFRGQNREHRFRRPVPNPRRSTADGSELSIMPGLYRQNAPTYSFSVEAKEQRSFQWFISELEPSSSNSYAGGWTPYDIMRTEQHYATPTAGLDLSFDIETALFFAVHRFRRDVDGVATYDAIPAGSHTGIIYCFRFGAPGVRRTEYHIREFDLFKTYRPERIVRQACALPLISALERNIAITEIDCIIRLHSDFGYDGTLTPQYMFPNAKEDPFYGKLLELKDRHPQQLASVVEYDWARP
jgi:hypothetical protein